MLKVLLSKWSQTPESLLSESIHAAHPRTRERFSALYQVTRGASAASVAKGLKRRHDTVTGWIHNYNNEGPQALIYKRSGGHPPFAQ
ncbi:MAG: helix-turn-helix domain-containing protein [Endozoicomonas sp.]